MSEAFKELRDKSNLTLKEMIDEFGGMWRAIENGSMPSPISYEVATRLFERFPTLKFGFVETDLTTQIHEWKKIIKLPMVLNA